MTDTTHEAPERVWATMMDPECARSGTFVDLKEYPTKPNHDAVEYVRADLVQAAVAAALREADKAIQSVANNCTTEDGHVAILAAVEKVRSLIPEGAQAALDRYVKKCSDDLVQAAVAVREAQKAYFKDRSRDNLIASKQAEAALDKMLAAIREGGE